MRSAFYLCRYITSRIGSNSNLSNFNECKSFSLQIPLLKMSCIQFTKVQFPAFSGLPHLLVFKIVAFEFILSDYSFIIGLESSFKLFAIATTIKYPNLISRLFSKSLSLILKYKFLVVIIFFRKLSKQATKVQNRESIFQCYQALSTSRVIFHPI